MIVKGKFDLDLKQHAKFGAFTLFQKLLKDHKIKAAALAFFIVERHHANLKEFWQMEDLAKKNGREHRVFEKQKKRRWELFFQNHQSKQSL